MAAANSNHVLKETTTVIRSRKRQHPPVFNGVVSSFEDKNSDFLCPVCFDTIEEAHMTKCGHTFCFKCISTSLEQNNRCPKCNFVVDKKDQIFPNFTLNELITKHKKQLAEKKKKLDIEKSQCVSDFQDFLANADCSDKMDLSSVNYMLGVLAQKKVQLEAESSASQTELLKEFLNKVKQRKETQISDLSRELECVNDDLKSIDDSINKNKSKYVVATALSQTSIKEPAFKIATLDSNWFEESRVSSFGDEEDGVGANSSCTTATIGDCVIKEEPTSSINLNSNKQDGFNGSQHSSVQQWFRTTTGIRRKRMHCHFEDLEQCYMLSRGATYGLLKPGGLTDFKSTLNKFTRFCSIRPLSTLNYASDLFNSSSIVSSIEFDKDNEFFAIAGVTKKIKVFEYSSVIQNTIDIHYPINEMICNSKISCISWSSYHKSMLASSDYEGSVTLWDAFTGQKVRLFQEHEKRCWSVDFNKVDTKLIASGSDDSRVKLWSTNTEHSIACLEAKANVCCVKFNPESRYHLAFGSADHFVHYYDLRNPKQALGVFRGHKKAVSYVKFLSAKELVSASTDSQLKLWNVDEPHCLRSFKGHLNEKNFVGLATDSDYIACGSENNSLYVYYKGLTTQIVSFQFDTVKSVLEKDKKDDDLNEFVSAVCWRTGSNVVVAANSQGSIKVLELV